MSDRCLPYDKDAEMSLIGSAVLSPDAAESMLLTVREHDFYFDANRASFRAIRTLQQSSIPIDAVTFAEQLQRDGTLDLVGGVQTVLDYMQQVPHAEHVSHYAAIVCERAKRRNLIQAATEVSRKAYEIHNDPDELANQLASKIDDLSGLNSTGPRTAQQVASTWREQQARPARIISTGLIDLDKALAGGWRENQLVTVGARPAMGKTAFAATLLEGAAANGDASLLLSLEMSSEEIVGRIAKRGKEHLQKFQSLPILFEDQVFDIDTISATIRREVSKHRIRLVVIDYVQLIETADRRASPGDQIAAVTRRLKRLAKQHKITIVILAQLNRELEKRDDKRPKLSDLRQSGSIEQDSDIVTFLYRPEVYDATDRPGEAEVIIAKQREFRTSTVKTTYVSDETRFANYSNRQVDAEYKF